MTSKEIKELRASKKMTQKEFAIALNVSKRTVEEWESGRVRPGRRSLMDLVEFVERGE